MATSALRKYPLLPVHIVEDHQDALYHLLRAVGSKHLPFNHNLLVHFDSHPDLLIPAELKASEVYDVPIMLQKLSIENWILGSAFAGQISTVVWVKPPWANQIENGCYSFLIGRQKGTEDLRVSCPISYYVGEMLYCREEALEDAKKVELLVYTLGCEENEKLTNKLIDLSQQHGNNFILDIDLDFFTTINPFIDMYNRVDTYDRLKQIYYFEFSATEDTEAIEAQVERRASHMSTLKEIFSSLHKAKDVSIVQEQISNLCSKISDDSTKEKLRQLVLDISAAYGEEVDWEMVHDAGSTCDDDLHQLPHHVSTSEEIEQLVRSFAGLVSRLPPPTIVTVARSSLDNYCPPHQVEAVQDKVCRFLNQTFDIDLKKHYEEDS